MRGTTIALAIALGVAGARAADDTPPSYADTTLTGDWNGLRSTLRDQGIVFTLTQTGDVLGNPTGGIEQAVEYDNVFEAQLDLDMAMLAGWTGGKIHLAGYAIQGPGLTASVGNLLTLTSVEAQPGLRVGEVYVSQSFLNEEVTLKFGQILADQNFAISPTAGLFVNSTFGWPGLFALDLPGGGPAYPLAVPGAQLILKPDDAWTLQAAIFNGSPTDNDTGLGFEPDGVFAIAEASYSYMPGKNDHSLPVTYKVGAWYNSQEFDSLTTASNGVSLANPLASANPLQLSGDFALYAIADRTLWQEAGSGGDTLNGFARVAVAPQQDRNLISWYFDLGLTYKGLLPGRDDDIAGLAFAYAQLSDGAIEIVEAENAFGGLSQPVPTAEAVIEATYQIAVTSAVSVQPFLQYVIHPGGNAEDPETPGEPIPNATILGARLALSF